MKPGTGTDQRVKTTHTEHRKGEGSERAATSTGTVRARAVGQCARAELQQQRRSTVSDVAAARAAKRDRAEPRRQWDRRHASMRAAGTRARLPWVGLTSAGGCVGFRGHPRARARADFKSSGNAHRPGRRPAAAAAGWRSEATEERCEDRGVAAGECTRGCRKGTKCLARYARRLEDKRLRHAAAESANGRCARCERAKRGTSARAACYSRCTRATKAAAAMRTLVESAIDEADDFRGATSTSASTSR